MIYELKYTSDALSYYCEHNGSEPSIVTVPFGRIFITDTPEFTYLEACEYCKKHNLRMLSRQEIIQVLITLISFEWFGSSSTSYSIVINDRVFDAGNKTNASSRTAETLSCWAENTVENMNTGKFVFDIIFDTVATKSSLCYNINSEKDYSLKKYILCTDGVQQMI